MSMLAALKGGGIGAARLGIEERVGLRLWWMRTGVANIVTVVELCGGPRQGVQSQG